MASWAVETVLPPGVFMTSTPFRVASATSMLSIPTPARPITFMLVAFAKSAGVACDKRVGGGCVGQPITQSSQSISLHNGNMIIRMVPPNKKTTSDSV